MFCEVAFSGCNRKGQERGKFGLGSVNVEDRGQKGLSTDGNPAVTGKGKEGWSTGLLLCSVEREGPLEDGGPELSCG